MTTERFTYLLDQYLAQTCTDKEKQELAILILTSKDKEVIEGFLRKAWDHISPEEEMPQEKASQIIDSILQEIPTGNRQYDEPAKIKRFTFTWRKIAVAASILLIVGLGGYFLLPYKSEKKHEMARTNEPAQDVSAPKTAKATLTLANGKQVLLDSAVNGTLAVQKGVKIEKLADGQLVYSGNSASMQYNLLENPRGSKVINLTLSDGTKVWLNSESSLRYPVAYIGNERQVEITGEAYFEVAHNAHKPFHVSVDGVDVKVLGTHFNVNAYEDEGEVKVTLLEGSVSLKKGNMHTLILPGEQVRVSHTGNQFIVKKGIDPACVMAWKDGFFEFNNLPFSLIMKQIKRWYDVDIIFESDDLAFEKFGGRINKDLPLSELLKMFKNSGVRFDIRDKTILITKTNNSL